MELSYADLIQLGAYSALEYTGGPIINFKMGREDAEESHKTTTHLLDPNA